MIDGTKLNQKSILLPPAGRNAAQINYIFHCYLSPTNASAATNANASVAHRLSQTRRTGTPTWRRSPRKSRGRHRCCRRLCTRSHTSTRRTEHGLHHRPRDRTSILGTIGSRTALNPRSALSIAVAADPPRESSNNEIRIVSGERRQGEMCVRTTVGGVCGRLGFAGPQLNRSFGE